MFFHLLLKLFLKKYICQSIQHRFGVTSPSPDQNERVKGIKTGWSDDQPRPSKAHALPYMVYGLDLQTSQLLCPSPLLESADWP